MYEVAVNGRTVARVECIADGMVIARAYGARFGAREVRELFEILPGVPGAMVPIRDKSGREVTISTSLGE